MDPSIGLVDASSAVIPASVDPGGEGFAAPPELDPHAAPAKTAPTAIPTTALALRM
jgi:hypothetical protein